MHRVLHPAHWPKASGYSNGVSSRGTQIYVSGQIGWDHNQEFKSDDFVAQVDQALQNVLAVMKEGGAEPEHMVRMTWYVVNKEMYVNNLGQIGAVYRRLIGRHYPAMSCVVVAALIEARALVEIEVTAVVPD